ncbi:MAG: hypothetical protein GTO14_02425 [Anaerolineales bacterium]|nr:hypothetical protein [Anaerolineales bacterium]
MLSLFAVFGLFVVLFAIMGGMRGWAKELLVTSAVILALFIIQILERHIRPYYTALLMQPPATQFILRALMLVLLAFFGYQTPHIRALQPKLARERLQDVLLGLLMGALNGYLLFGSIWFYLDQMGYDNTTLVTMPSDPVFQESVQNFMGYLPPSLIPIPHIYFVVGVVFVFIIVVFV